MLYDWELHWPVLDLSHQLAMTILTSYTVRSQRRTQTQFEMNM